MAFDNKLFAKLLKETRESKMTLEVFAEKMDMNERSIARIESGERLTTLPKFFEICQILDITPDQLYTTYMEANTHAETDSDFEQLLKMLCQMDSKELALASEIIHSIEKYR